MSVQQETTHTKLPAYGRAWRIAFIMLQVMLAVVLAAKYVVSAGIVASIFGYAFQVDESESMIVAETLLLDRGTNIYDLPRADIFISAPYTPLYYLLTWPGAHFGGTLPSFKPGRAISLLAVAGIIVLLVLLTAHLTRQWRGKADWLAAALSGAVFTSLGLVAFWGSAVKPDITALFFGLLGLYCGARWLVQTKTSYFWLYMAALAGALALFTKQTSVAGVAAFGFYLLLVRRDVRATLRFGLVYVLLALMPMLVLNVVTNGGFWYHIVTVHQLPWSFEGYTRFFGEYVQTYAFYVGLALAGIGVIVLSRTRRLDMLAVFYVAMGFLASLSAGTYGGNHNHFLDLAAAMALMIGLLAARLRVWSATHRVARPFYIVVLLVLLVQCASLTLFEGKSAAELRRLPGYSTLLQSLATYDWLPRQYRDPRDLDPEHRFDEIAAYMSNAAGPVYSDNVSLVLASGKPLTTTDPYTQTHAVYFGRWNEARLLADIRAHTYAVIALTDFPAADSLIFRDPKSNGLGAAGIFITPELARAVKAAYTTPRKDKLYVFERTRS